MKLLRGLQSFASLINQGTVVTIGNFDGVHRGHQALLALLRKEADLRRLPVLVVLFEPQPREFFLKSEAPLRISQLREKVYMLQQYGVDYVYCLRFDKNLASMSPEVFAERYLFSSLGAKYLSVGRDFRFGHNRLGNIDLLKTLGHQWACVVKKCPDFYLEKDRISSTEVRRALEAGALAKVATLLGRTYSMCGRVVHGDARGRCFGVPTANLRNTRTRLPLKGVFCVQVKRKGHLSLLTGVANIGNRPTLDGFKNVLEVHLLNFDESLYGEQLEVFFLHKLRDEVKFASLDTLIAQIHRDVAAATAYFKAQS